MALTPSTMLPIGTVASDFLLPDTVSGDNLSYERVAGELGTVIMFICNHCPYVKHVRSGLVDVAKDYRDRGIGFAAVSSNDAQTHPEDGPDAMAKMAKAAKLPFPYLYDATQDMARAYRAACTPDFFVFDAQARLPRSPRRRHPRQHRARHRRRPACGARCLVAGQSRT